MTSGSPSLPALIQAARAADAQGRFAQAESLARQGLAANPASPAALAILGIALAKQMKLREAVLPLTRAAELDAHAYEPRLWLSRIARKEGRSADSVTYGEAALAIAPMMGEAVINLGLSLVDAHAYGRAAELLQAAAERNPGVAPIRLHLGHALTGLRKLDAALAAYAEAAGLDPRLAEAHIGSGRIYLALGDAEAAVRSAERAISASPGGAAGHHLMIEALTEANRSPDALLHARHYVATHQTDAVAQALLGKCLLTAGDRDEARAALEHSIAAQPAQGAAYCLLTQSRRVGEADRDLVEKMRAVAAGAPLPPVEAAYLHYGLGKADEDLGDYAEAMRHFDEANRQAYAAKFGPAVFDRGAYAAITSRLIETFDRAFIARHAHLGNPAATPVFIVGMIRSGTTLVEQILSCHPDVGAAGEQRFWQVRWHSVMRADEREVLPTALAEAATAYLSQLAIFGPAKARVTDKLPGNFLRLGLLHIAFPNARFIHMRRNPIDTCLSIWTTPNSAPNEFAHDKSNIVFAYREYQRLMAHWRSTLPEASILELDYESLVEDAEAQTRRLVAFVGLPWDDACLRPEDAGRAVSTPSVLQVRRPVYATSIGRWRHYRTVLGPFAELADSA